MKVIDLFHPYYMMSKLPQLFRCYKKDTVPSSHLYQDIHLHLRMMLTTDNIRISGTASD